MMKRPSRIYLTLLFSLPGLLACPPALGQREMETLDRGVVAVRTEPGKVRVGWRLFGNEPQDTAFNLYRVTTGKPERLEREVA